MSSLITLSSLKNARLKYFGLQLTERGHRVRCVVCSLRAHAKIMGEVSVRAHGKGRRATPWPRGRPRRDRGKRQRGRTTCMWGRAFATDCPEGCGGRARAKVAGDAQWARAPRSAADAAGRHRRAARAVSRWPRPMVRGPDGSSRELERSRPWPGGVPRISARPTLRAA